MKPNYVAQKGWKVVAQLEGSFYLRSALQAVRDGDTNIVYQTNGLTRPRVGKIFVFNNERSAREFTNVLNNVNKEAVKFRLWEVMAYGNTLLENRLEIDFAGNFERVKSFWRNPNKPSAGVRPIVTPLTERVSFVSKSVRLLKDITVPNI